MKKNNIEKRIYEHLGIKSFKKLAFAFAETFLFIPKLICNRKQNLKEIIINTKKDFKNINGSNYVMKKGNGLQDLRDFKKCLLFNTLVHLYGFYTMIPYYLKMINGNISIESSMFILTMTILNSYCLMLQRYNNIRINETLTKWEPIENKQKEKIKEELHELTKNSNYTYSIRSIYKKKTVTAEELINSLSLSDLKRYKLALIQMQESNSYSNTTKLSNRRRLTLN